MPELAEDPRLRTHHERGANMEAIDAIIASWTSERKSGRDRRSAVSGRRARRTDQQRHHDSHRRALRRPRDGPPASTPDGWEVPMSGVVPKFSRTPGSVDRTGPELGEHTADVLGELAGVDGTELELHAGGCGMTGRPLLEVKDLTVRFGGVMALDGISFDVHEGQICALIGPNGAGKTTLFNVDQPHLRARQRDDHDFDGPRPAPTRPRPTDRSLGIIRTFQNLALCPGMTVLENVMVGAHTARPGRLRRARRSRLGARARGARAARAAPTSCSSGSGSPTSRTDRAAGLPFGTLKRIELARALAGAAEAADARRAGQRPDPRRGRRARRAHPPAARRLRAHGPARRAPHGDGDGRSPTTSSCSTSAARSPRARPTEVPDRPEGDRGLPGDVPHAPLTRCSKVDGPLTPGYGPVAGRCTASTSRWTRARSSSSSAPTAPARPRRCGRSARWSDDQGTIDARRRGAHRPADDQRSSARASPTCPQGRGTFADLTVEDNLRAGAYVRKDRRSPPTSTAGTRSSPGCGERRTQPAGSLSGGEQQMLADRPGADEPAPGCCCSTSRRSASRR